MFSGKNPKVNKEGRAQETDAYPVAVQLCNTDSEECVNYNFAAGSGVGGANIFELKNAPSTFWGPTSNVISGLDTPQELGTTRDTSDSDYADSAFLACCSGTDCSYAGTSEAQRAAVTKAQCTAASGTWHGKGIYLKVSFINNAVPGRCNNDRKI